MKGPYRTEEQIGSIIFLCLCALAVMAAFTSDPTVRAGWIQGILTFAGVVVGFTISRRLEHEKQHLETKREVYLKVAPFNAGVLDLINSHARFKLNEEPEARDLDLSVTEQVDLICSADVRTHLNNYAITIRRSRMRLKSIRKAPVEAFKKAHAIRENRAEIFKQIAMIQEAQRSNPQETLFQVQLTELVALVEEQRKEGAKTIQAFLDASKGIRNEVFIEWKKVNSSSARLFAAICRDLGIPHADEDQYFKMIDSITLEAEEDEQENSGKEAIADQDLTSSAAGRTRSDLSL